MSAVQTLRAGNAEELRAILAEAGEAKRKLRVVGGGSKRALFDTERVDAHLDLSGLVGITRYEPEELVLSLRAGTRLAEVENLLAERGQMLAFEPPDYARVLGAKAGCTTMGGAVASGFAGPRRVAAGNVRDHVLGFDGVSGRGEIFRAGGRVIKNVTGYDLPKLMTGSWGTLAVLTDLTLRVLPRPQHQATLLIEGLGDRAALAAMTQALQASLEVSAAAHLPSAPTRTAIRLEGFRPSVEERMRQLRKLLAGIGALRGLEQVESAALWRGVRDLEVFQNDARILWRLSLPASSSADVVAAISRCAPNEALYDWGGSLVWVAMNAEPAAAIIRGEVAKAGGHAWLMRAPESLRREIPTAHPQTPGLEALSRRIKSGFDPRGVLGYAPLLSKI